LSAVLLLQLFKKFRLFVYSGRRIVLKSLLIIFFLFIATSLHAIQETDSGRHRLIVRGDYASPPFEFLESDGTAAGFNVDIFKAVADVMGLDFELSLGLWNEVREELENDKIDVLTGMYYSSLREEKLDYSTPYLIVHHSIFVRQNSPIEKMENLPDKEIIVQQGNIMNDYATINKLSNKIITVPTAGDAVQLLASGKHDCALLDKFQGLYLINQLHTTNITTTDKPFLPREFCFAVHIGNYDLLMQLNEGLRIIQVTGQYKEIYDKWFGGLERHGLVGSRIVKLAKYIFGLFMVLFLISALWSLQLKRKITKRTTELQKELLERQKAEESLKRREKEVRTLLDNLPGFVYFKTPDGVYLAANQTFCSTVGISQEQLPGKTDRDLFPKHVAEKYHEDDMKLIRTGSPIIVDEEEMMINGRPMMITTRKVPIKDEKGNAVGLIGMGLDITNLKLAEQDKAKLEDQLRQAMKMEAIGRLAGGIAHDFNNILTSIIGYSDLLWVSLRPMDPLRKDLGEIRKAANRASALIQQLLAFSRKQMIAPRVMDLNELISQNQKMLSRIIGEDIELVFFPTSNLGSIKTDPSQIEQILINLAVNARDAMPNGGKLTVQTQNAVFDEEYSKLKREALPGNYVLMAVSDTGMGMTEETKYHLFEPFFTTKEKDKGTGLGLATVYGIVKQNKGYIYFYSELGIGTTCKIYFPRVEEEPMPLPIADKKQITKGTETILVVEDEEMLRALACRILERQGYKVLESSDAGKAFLICHEYNNEIDLLLTDMIMPAMNGRQLYENLKMLRPNIKVLYMSGYTEDVIVHHGILEEKTHFIQKPFTIDDLARKVRDVLDM